jgi:hypothetical protein
LSDAADLVLLRAQPNMVISGTLVTIVAAALGASGAIAGVIVGQRLQARARQLELDSINRKEMLANRMQLLERLTSAMVKFGRVEAIMTMFEIERMPYELDVIKEVVKHEGQLPPGYFKKGIDITYLLSLNKEVCEVQAEFNAVANLSMLYFGDKTREALNRAVAVTPWYKVAEHLRREVVTCMANEVTLPVDPPGAFPWRFEAPPHD